MTAATSTSSAPRAAMISPIVDLLAIGGLSIVVCVGLIAFGATPFDQRVPSLVPYLLTAGITWPHFAASYRLLYATKESILTYKVASIYFPAALAAFAVFAVAFSRTNDVPVHLLNLAAGVYLARHYTGQTWGMMASFSHIEGKAFSPRERRVFQWSLGLVMVWHMTWAASFGIGAVLPALEPIVHRIDAHVDLALYLSFGVGLAGLGLASRRTGQAPPARVVVPWLALYSWYALLRHDPTSLVVVQASHALQYLIFPLRIDHTRAASAGPVRARYAAGWLVVLLVLSVAVFAGIPQLFRLTYLDSGGVGEITLAFTAVFAAFVNIHHYFIDSCLYKLRNPAVRRDLFAHLP